MAIKSSKKIAEAAVVIVVAAVIKVVEFPANQTPKTDRKMLATIDMMWDLKCIVNKIHIKS